jgi:hypothetical protein
MQIHEVTRTRQSLDEALPMPSLAGNIKKYAKAAMDPEAWKNQGGLQRNLDQQEVQQQTQNYVKQLAGEWAQVAKSIMQTGEPRPAPTKAAAQPATQPAAQATTQPKAPAVKPKVGTPSYQISAPPGQGLPTSAEQEKFQQRISQALGSNKTVQEAFADLPGTPPPAGGQVSPTVTARPNTQAYQNRQIRTSNQATKFQQWAATKLKSVIPGTSIQVGLETLQKDPAINQQLNTALTQVVRTMKDPQANTQAVENYFMIAVTGLQKTSAKLRAQAPARSASSTASGGSNISKSQLYNLGRDITSKGERVTVPTTGSATVDNILKQAGLM